MREKKRGALMEEEKTEIDQLREEMESLKQKLFIHTAVIVALCAFHDTTVVELMSSLAQDRYHPNTYKMYRDLAKHHGINFDEFFDAIEELNPWWPFKNTQPKKTEGGE
jgi:hypothetical protein